MSESLQDFAFKTATPGGPIDYLEDQYNNALKGVGRKLWRGMLQVAASGFGKGLLVTAGAIIGITALIAGYGGFAEQLTVNGVAIQTFQDGLVAGAKKAIEFLVSGFGLTSLAIGGTLGAVSDVRRHQNKLTAEMARAEAAELERKRNKQHLQELLVARDEVVPEKNCSYCQKEMQRRTEGEQPAARSV